MKKQKGFTILELLITMAIFAILTSIVLISMTTVKEKNRDAVRMSHLKQIENALNLYYSNNNVFPIAAAQIDITGSDALSIALENDGATREVQPDPLHPNVVYTYQSVDGTTYTVTFCLETNTIQSYSQGCGNTLTP
ncbi:type II secretion system protein [Patescibacteria group bacterium]